LPRLLESNEYNITNTFLRPSKTYSQEIRRATIFFNYYSSYIFRLKDVAIFLKTIIKMLDYKKQYYNKIDEKAKEIANDFINRKPITESILKFINELYLSAKVEQSFKSSSFETAYHAPISSELEFYIARIFYHLSELERKEWKILLRRQQGKTAPDIRIEERGETIAIIEVKAKAGWIQPFFSEQRYNVDKERFEKGSSFDPDALIRKSKLQLTKYSETFDITNKDIFLFLPTLALVHRKKYNTSLQEYRSYFSKTSGFPEENLILLSKDKSLDLSLAIEGKELSPTRDFEKLLDKLLKK